MADVLTSSPLAHAIGLALVHFFWQGAVLGAAAAVLFAVSRRRSAHVRYLIGCITLAAMTAAVVLTFAGYARELRSISTPRSVEQLASALPPIAAQHLATETPRAADASWFAAAAIWAEARWPIVLLIWSAGVLCLSLHLLRGWLLVQRIRRIESSPMSAEWTSRIHALAARLHIRRPLRLLESTWVEVPSVIGWIRPVILVPASALAGLSPTQFGAILAHELAHVRRHDYLVNVAQSVVEVLLFYHPAVWFVSRRIRLEREQCCDDLAVELCGDRVAYAAALMSLEEGRAAGAAFAMGAQGGDLLQRVRRLIGGRPAARPSLPAWAAIGAVISMVSVVIAADVQGTTRTSGAAASVQVAAAATPPVQPVQQGSASDGARAVSLRRQQPSATSPPVGHAQTAASAQVNSSTITGAVIDPQGARLPGAYVRVLSPDDIAKTALAVTNAYGRYAVAVPPGTYDVMVWLAGFRTSMIRVQAPAGETRVDVRLDIGGLTETITTSAGRPPSAAVATAAPTPNTPSAYFDAARRYLDQGRLDDAYALIQRGYELQVQPGSVSVDPSDQGPVRVGGDIKEPKKIRDVKPAYPPDALAAGIQGIVIIEAVIARDGTVKDAKVLRSIPPLDDAALSAVRQWAFTPTLLNGVPVEVIMTVTVNFVAQ